MNKLIICIVAIFLSGCLSSVSTDLVKTEGLKNKDQAKSILKKSLVAQGWNTISKFETYEVIANNYWKGTIGKIGTVWPDADINLNLKYAIGTFDGQVTYLNSKSKGEIHGLQSWQSYEIAPGKKLVKFKTKLDKKVAFGLSAFQYFFELTSRMNQLDLITYAGEKQFNGKTYSLVFATWDKLKTHRQHDQYLLWINKETFMLEYCEFTVHDPLMIGGRLATNTIHFSNFQEVQGVQIPFELKINVGKPTTKSKKFVHKLSVEAFKFDTFPIDVLYPNKNLQRIGDSKN